MSTNEVSEALDSFLVSPQPVVMALTGKWGVGKTYLWRQRLCAAARSKTLNAPTYSYVSLFGMEALAELRSAILVNGGSPDKATLDPDAEYGSAVDVADGFRTKFRDARRWVRQRFRVKEDLPELLEQVDLGGLLRTAMLRGVHRYLVCIDDVERRGVGLRMRDLLGYVANLRDERRCSVLLILNDDELSSEDQTELGLLREKVFDHEVRYEPATVDCAQLVFPAADVEWATVRANCIRLGIDNIRILQRIRQTYLHFARTLGAEDEVLQHWLAHSIPLLVLAHYSKDDRHPTVDYVLESGLGRLVRRATGDQKPEDREDWHQFLDEYGYKQIAAMDKLARDYLRTGIIRTLQLTTAIEEVRTSEHRRAAEQKFTEAWEMFHDSFERNEDELLEALAVALRNNFRWTSPGNVSSTTTLFRELDRDSDADALVREYVELLEKEAPQTLDLRYYPFSDRIGDAKLKAAMAAAYQANSTPVSLSDAVKRLTDGSRWTAADTEALECATVDQIVGVLHDLRGHRLQGAVRGLLQFGSTSQSDYHLVSRRALEALRRIEAESALNGQRMRRYYPLPQFPPPPVAAREPAVN